MNRILQQLKEIPISLETIRDYCPEDVGVIMYDHIQSSSKANFFKGKRAMIVFYEMHENNTVVEGIGHFSLIINKKIPYYWSSYGFKPEFEINKTKSEPGKLLKILGKHNYNKVRYQKIRHTNTCGLHCLSRSYLLDYGEEEYKRMLTNRLVLSSPDLIVCLMCLILVRKELQ